MNQSENLKVSMFETYTKVENHKEEINKTINNHQAYIKGHEIEFQNLSILEMNMCGS